MERKKMGRLREVQADHPCEIFSLGTLIMI